MRLIDADAVRFETGLIDNGILFIPYRDIAKAPTVDAEPVRHGLWVEQDKYTFGTMYDCSICDNRILDNGHSWNYCPNCGAKMDEN